MNSRSPHMAFKIDECMYAPTNPVNRAFSSDEFNSSYELTHDFPQQQLIL